MRPTPPEEPPQGELETHRPWLSELARALLRDPSLAEDCVQDVFLAAVRELPTAAGFSLRGWLRQVLVNRARKLGERDSLRRFHERRALVEGRRLAELEPLELRELRAELEHGLLALDERQREALRLRHQEGLAPSAIAQRLDVPVKTVDSWLYRAHGKLRERLAGRFRDLGACLALLARAGEERGAPQATPALPHEQGRDARVRPRTRLRTRWLAAAAGLVLVTAAVFRFTTESEPADERSARREVPRAVLTLPATPPRELEPREPRPAEDPVPASKPAVLEDAPDAAAPLWRGRVIDPDGAPVAGVRLRFEPMTAADWRLLDDRAHSGLEGYEDVRFAGEDPSAVRYAVSDAEGAFTFPEPRVQGWIDVDSDGWTLVTSTSLVELPPLADAHVCIARDRRVAGHVLAADGTPVAGARVALHLPARLVRVETRFPSGISYEPDVLTDADGRFELPWLPAVDDARLSIEKDGFAHIELRLDELGDAPEALGLTLAEEQRGPELAGRTLDAAGAPIAGAVLSLDWTTLATSDPEGRFRLPLAEVDAERVTVRAAALGFLPLERTLDPRAVTELELVFTGPALALAGVVLTSDGTPHANAAVWLPAPSVLALPPDGPPVLCEHVMGGPQDGGSLEVALTDADGRFELRGLAARSYVVRVADQATRAWFASGLLEAGQRDVWLEFPPEACLEEVRGVVVARDGEPLTDVYVARTSPRLDVRLPDGRRYASHASGAKERVAADGSFVLRGVGRASSLSVLGPAIQNRHFELERLGDPLALRLEVGRLCRVVVERGALEFERFSFAAAPGERFDFLSPHTGVLARLSEAPLLGERSDEYLVNDLARELVLWSGAREVARLPVALSRGELNVLRP
jgi:RNA polymerase sigma-70 factor (ECF subfamily)